MLKVVLGIIVKMGTDEIFVLIFRSDALIYDAVLYSFEGYLITYLLKAVQSLWRYDMNTKMYIDTTKIMRSAALHFA
jgi:histidyl-tRNA synthetase